MFVAIRTRLEDKEEGFTLIELLVVVIIIGILAAIAIPVFLRQRERGYVATVNSDLRNAAVAAETHFTTVMPNAYPTTLAQLQAAGYTPSADVTVGFGAAAAGTFCLTADHALLAPATDGVYDSDDGGIRDTTPGC